MSHDYFEIHVELRETDDGRVDVGVPTALEGSSWTFVLLDERRGKALVELETGSADAEALQADGAVREIPGEELAEVAGNYRSPCIKQEYEDEQAGEDEPEAEEPPAARLLTLQTIRSGFHLADVPVNAEPVAEVFDLPRLLRS